MTVKLDFSCMVLAGGKGSRLGSNKLLKTVGEKNLLEHVIGVIDSFNKEIILVSAREQSLPQVTYISKLRIVHDIHPGKGVLGGLYTGLVASKSFYNLVVASDMPFLNRKLLSYMIQCAEGFDAVIPRLGNMVEPVHSIYSKNCIGPIEGLLKKDILKISDLFPLIKIKYIETEEIERFDPQHLSIFNINTASDLERARELAR